MTPVLKRTKNDGNSPKNNHLSIDEDISKTQEILDISINSNDISIVTWGNTVGFFNKKYTSTLPVYRI